MEINCTFVQFFGKAAPRRLAEWSRRRERRLEQPSPRGFHDSLPRGGAAQRLAGATQSVLGAAVAQQAAFGDLIRRLSLAVERQSLQPFLFEGGFVLSHGLPPPPANQHHPCSRRALPASVRYAPKPT